MEELKSKLLYAPKNGYTSLNAEQRAEMESYCKRYAAFMDACKTEREATAWAVETAKANGFQEMKPGMAVKPGDKVAMGDTIGYAADSAIVESTLGSHVHFSVTHYDEPMDPEEFLNLGK